MSEILGVAELKRRFSEILNRIEVGGERVVVRRRGRAVAVLSPADDESLAAAPPPKPRRGLVAAAGAWEEYDDIDGFLDEIRAARDAAPDRAVDPLG